MIIARDYRMYKREIELEGLYHTGLMGLLCKTESIINSVKECKS